MGIFAATVVFSVVVLSFLYAKYTLVIESKLRGGPFHTSSMVYAAPRRITPGDVLTPGELVNQLERSGYSTTPGKGDGWYVRRASSVEIHTGADSYFSPDNTLVEFSRGRIAQITGMKDGAPRDAYLLEPEIVSSLADASREKRRLIQFSEIPTVLVNAVVSVEDKRFFRHPGFDPLRVLKAVWVDVREGEKAQGASTLDMQLARNFFLHSEKTWGRKIKESLIALNLEMRLTKQQIFEYYANQVYLGRRGSFSVQGFGEGARTYLGKDVRSVSLPEAAFLAGIIQRPSYFNPWRNPQRAKARRDLVLSLMRDNDYITEDECAKAAASPLRVAPQATSESADAPYFVDLVNSELESQFEDTDFKANNFRIYTSLDLELQRDAVAAVAQGMKEVDARIAPPRRKKKGPPPPPAVKPQVALVCLDSQTGAVKALIGGRDYGQSQLNRATALRQPGSSFKPFVYAAALNAAVQGGSPKLTPATHLVDEPTTFWNGNKPYTPGNFGNEFHGDVTVRQALAKSLNIPAVKVAEMVGYRKVVEVAKRAGMNEDIKPTPAVALGAYDVTPLEVASAYTIFSRGGTHVPANWVEQIRNRRGKIVYTYKGEANPVIDPRAAYLVVNLMQEVLRSGTGASVRSRGFSLPAAGKTGSSRDGWFAGFTSKLLCVVWVGYDDGHDLRLEGAKSALPVWTEFMKRAHQHPEYRDVKDFAPPAGIVSVEIDPESGQLATEQCPTRQTEVFAAGTEPTEQCQLHAQKGILDRILGIFK